MARRAVVARVLNACQPDQLQRADVDPPDVDLEPARLELRAARIGMVVVVQFLSAEPDGDGRDVSALVLYLEVAIAERMRSEEHTSELQSHSDLVCRLLLEKKKKKKTAQQSDFFQTSPACLPL